MIIVPSAGVGIVLGGYIIKKLKLGARESAKLAMICSGMDIKAADGHQSQLKGQDWIGKAVQLPRLG